MTTIAPGQFHLTREADLVMIHFDGSAEVVAMPFNDALRFSAVLSAFVTDHLIYEAVPDRTRKSVTLSPMGGGS